MEIKFAIIGDNQVGKKSWVTRIVTGEFKNTPTTDFVFDSHMKKQNNEIVNVKFRQTENMEDADATIVMFSVSDQASFAKVPEFLAKAKGVVVLVGNKCDIKKRTVPAKQITKFLFKTPERITYFDVSAKSNYNQEKPFLYIARKFFNDSKMNFVESPAVAPPVAVVPIRFRNSCAELEYAFDNEPDIDEARLDAILIS